MYGINEPFHRKKIMDKENRFVVAKAGGGIWMDWEFGVNRCKLLPLEWISNEILRCGTGNYISSLRMEQENGRKRNVCVCV